MGLQKLKFLAVPALSISALCACAANYAVYEAPISGTLSEIALVNAADRQRASLETFEDGRTCSGKRRIQFDGKDGVPAGAAHSLTVTSGKVFALLVSLNTIETEDFAIELGKTSGAPAPVMNRTVTAIGCSAMLSFEVEPDKNYRIDISEPVSSRSCSVRVSEFSESGHLVPVETDQRSPRTPRNESGSFCAPLEQ